MVFLSADASLNQFVHLWVTGHLLDFACSCLGTFHFPGKLSHLSCWKFLKLHITIIYGLGCKFLITQEKPKDVMMQDLGCFWGLFNRIDLCLHCIVPFIHASTFLPSEWACTSLVCGLQNSSYFPLIVSRLRSSFDKPHYTYWSILKSPLQAITFLYFLCPGRARSSHSKWHLKVCGREHHWLSSRSWDLQCMA